MQGSFGKNRIKMGLPKISEKIVEAQLSVEFSWKMTERLSNFMKFELEKSKINFNSLSGSPETLKSEFKNWKEEASCHTM